MDDADEPVIDLRDSLADDDTVELLLDMPAALAMADRFRETGMGGDTVADRAEAPAPAPDEE